MKKILSFSAIMAVSLLYSQESSMSYSSGYYYNYSGFGGLSMIGDDVKINDGDLFLSSYGGIRNEWGSGGFDITSSGEILLNYNNINFPNGYGIKNEYGYGGFDINSSGDVEMNSSYLVLAQTYGIKNENGYTALDLDSSGNTRILKSLAVGDLSAFSGTFSNRSALDVIAHSDGDLITGYIDGSSGDRFNIELDSSNDLAKISSGGGYDLTLSTEGGTMNFESSSFGTATYAFNGDATISNDLIVSGDVTISSDARLKANIISLGSTLSKLLMIDGKSYTMKKDGKQKIGVLAQDIQKVFPELVSCDENNMLSVNYQGLVPVLINALKEQQSEIDKLKEKEKDLIKLEKRLSDLEKLYLHEDE